MVDVVDTSSTGQQVSQLLASALTQTPDGVELSYRVLEHVAALYQVDRAWLVLRPAVLGPQVFVRGRQAPTPTVVGDLLARPPGLYTDPDVVDPGVRRALAGTCTLVLSAQAARQAAAVDTASGLVGRTVTEAALARAAAQSARHGWPHTLVLLSAAPNLGDDRWAAFCGALRASLRTGDEAGEVGPRQALAILGNAEADVARPFLARLQTALEAVGSGDVEFTVATARSPDESVDPTELWRLLTERLATPRGIPAPRPERPAALSTPLELELRSLPGVVAVALTAHPTPAGGGNLQLSVVAVEPPDTLRLDVTRILGPQLAEATVKLVAVAVPARPHGEAGPRAQPPAGDHLPTGAPVTPGQPSPPDDPDDAGGAPAADALPPNGSWPLTPTFDSTPLPAEPLNGNGRAEAQLADQRVTLLTVRFDADTGTAQVDLAHGTARATGRATAGPLVGGAQATLAALEGLGLNVPYYLLSAERAAGITGEPVVVVLAPRRPDGERSPGLGRRLLDRIGVAEGVEPVEAASRATLGALNRYLAKQEKAPVA